MITISAIFVMITTNIMAAALFRHEKVGGMCFNNCHVCNYVENRNVSAMLLITANRNLDNMNCQVLIQ